MKLSIKLTTLLFAVITTLLAASCGNTKEIDQTTVWSISLKKGGCMDVCDSYEIKVENTGNFNYKGIHNVKHIGSKAGTIDIVELKQLEECIGSIDWSNSDTQYGSSGPGAQHKILIYTNGLERFTIEYYRLEPQEIRALEQLIDQIIDNDEL